MPYKDLETRRKKQIEATRKYRQRHPEKIRAMSLAYYWKHHDHMLQIMKASRERNKKARKAYRAKYNRELKETVIQAYGGACACCGETEISFLCIDHVNGGGTQHRKITGGGQKFYNWLKREGFPPPLSSSLLQL